MERGPAKERPQREVHRRAGFGGGKCVGSIDAMEVWSDLKGVVTTK
ncbi:hypothetical protein RRSWK_03768 [Rhodopirellula sp. SWK7]|nr:hypothetical protein RRSWK_03768 [Rhodopirellula sp. SWK7]